MSSKAPDKDMKALWQRQPVAAIQMTPEQLRKRSDRFRSRLRWRNLREYAAAIIVVPAFIANIVMYPSLPFRGMVLTGSGLIALATAFLVYGLHRYGWPRSISSDAGLQSCLESHRQELVRQRDLLRAWPWILVLVPGIAFMLIGFVLHNPAGRRIVPIFMAVGFFVLFAVTGVSNHWMARRHQKEIDALDSLRSDAELGSNRGAVGT